MSKDTQPQELELPPQVIRALYRFTRQGGCRVKIVHEKWKGVPIRRWVANDDYVLWTEETDE